MSTSISTAFIKQFESEFSTDKSERLAEDLTALNIDFHSPLIHFEDQFL